MALAHREGVLTHCHDVGLLLVPDLPQRFLQLGQPGVHGEGGHRCVKMGTVDAQDIAAEALPSGDLVWHSPRIEGLQCERPDVHREERQRLGGAATCVVNQGLLAVSSPFAREPYQKFHGVGDKLSPSHGRGKSFPTLRLELFPTLPFISCVIQSAVVLWYARTCA